MDSQIIDSVRSRIDEIIAAARIQGKSQAYLSYIGTHLGDIRHMIAASGFTLENYLKSHTKYDIKYTGNHGNVAYIEINDNSSADPQPLSTEKARKRYHPRFWSAFVFPKKSGERFVSEDTLYFVDTLDPDSLPKPREHWHAVPDNFIIDPDDPKKTDRVHRSIETWLEETQFPREKAEPALHRTVRGSRQSVLEAIVNCLNSSELPRVSMPLDIVKKLMDERI